MKSHAPPILCMQRILAGVLLLACAVEAPAATPPKGEAAVKEIVATYAADHDVGKARAALEKVAKEAPDTALPRFHLAILAEKERSWAQATYWFEEYLRLDGKSGLAAKIRQELAQLRRVQAFEASPLGAEHAKALALLDQTRAALVRQQPAAAADRVYDIFRLNPRNWDVQLVTAQVLISSQSFSLAQAMLISVWQQAPAARRPAIEKALLQCQQERLFTEQKTAAAALLRDKKTAAAAAAYLKAWEAAPQHTEVMALALQCAIVAEDYTLARSLLEKLQAAKRAGTPMPPAFQNCNALLAKVDALKAFKGSPKLAVKSGHPAPLKKSTTKKSGGSSKGSMVRDFMNRAKK